MKFLAGLLLVAAAIAACGQAGATANPATKAPTAAPASAAPSSAAGPGTAVSLVDFKLLPADLKVSGSSIDFQVTNSGPTVHNLTIRDGAGKIVLATPDLREKESARLTGTLAPGTYITFCSLPGHESLGIKGTLVVGP